MVKALSKFVPSEPSAQPRENSFTRKLFTISTAKKYVEQSLLVMRCLFLILAQIFRFSTFAFLDF